MALEGGHGIHVSFVKLLYNPGSDLGAEQGRWAGKSPKGAKCGVGRDLVGWVDCRERQEMRLAGKGLCG